MVIPRKSGVAKSGTFTSAEPLTVTPPRRFSPQQYALPDAVSAHRCEPALTSTKGPAPCGGGMRVGSSPPDGLLLPQHQRPSSGRSRHATLAPDTSCVVGVGDAPGTLSVGVSQPSAALKQSMKAPRDRREMRRGISTVPPSTRLTEPRRANSSACDR